MKICSKKKVIAAAMALAISVGGAVPAVMAAAPPVAAASVTGTYKDANGNSFEYQQTSSVAMTITGFKPGNNCKNIEVPASINGIPVRYIGNKAFDGQEGIETVKLNEGILTVGMGAFAGCTNLKSINIPSTTTNILPYAFINCKSLKQMSLPDSVKNLGNNTSGIVGRVFQGCSSLETVKLSSNLESLTYWSFRECTSLKKITIPASVKKIEQSFPYCSNLEEVVIEGPVQDLNKAFENCGNLKRIYLPKSVNNVGHMFENFENFFSGRNIDIYYEGTEAEFNKIEFNAYDYYYSVNAYNSDKTNHNETITVHYNSYTPKSSSTTTTPTTPTQPTTPSTTNPGKGSIMLDTANYIMAPGNVYDIGVTIKDPSGRTLSGAEVQALHKAGKLKVTDSRTGSVATLTQLSNGNFRVTGKQEGSCYIVYDIGGNHASVKIDVKRGEKQHGTAVRNTSYFTQNVF